jgi:glyoxylase-like metal-dependent hydrolase (beta-lactamase superfamily II)
MNPHNAHPVSRRHFLATTGLSGLAGWLARRDLFGLVVGSYRRAPEALGPVEKIRQAAATGPMTVQRLRGGISVVVGSGGNIIVLPGRDGVLLVDSGIVGRRVAESVTSISTAPVKHLINTHWHFDHTDANAWWHRHGASITAHENTRKHLSTSTRVVDWDFTFPPSPKDAKPAAVFSAEQSLELNGEKIELRHYQPAHTDSDIWVHFTEADVLHVGDTCWNGVYPFIDYSTGGSIDGSIRAANENLARVSANTVVVPGHGPVGGKDALTKYRDMLVAVRDRVATLKREGRSLADVISAAPTAAFDSVWNWPIVDSALFTRLVYEGV